MSSSSSPPSLKLRCATHYEDLESSLSEIYSSGRFCDVKIVCDDSEELWAHRLILGSVSPFLKTILVERADQDVAVLLLPHINAFHMRLVLDYIYRGAMFLCAGHVQFVVRVIEVLHLKVGVSVSKMVADDATGLSKWVESKRGLHDFLLYNAVKLESLSYEGEEEELEKATIVQPTIPEKLPLQRNEAVDVIEFVPEESDEDDEEAEEKKGPKKDKLVCVMCGREFQHQSNLKIHLQGHLGHKVQLKSCIKCKRNFRSSVEYELHMNSHRYTTQMKLRRGVGAPSQLDCFKPSSAKNDLRKKLLKSSVRKLVAKVIRDHRQQQENHLQNSSEQENHHETIAEKKVSSPSSSHPPPPPLSPPLSPSSSSLGSSSPPKSNKLRLKIKKAEMNQNVMMYNETHWCHLCQKSLSGKSSFRRHVTTQHKGLKLVENLNHPTPPPTENNRKRKHSSSLSVKKAPPPNPSKRNKPQLTSNNVPNRRLTDEDLTCPTCDKIFLASSIFERHLKTYKHGRYTAAAVAAAAASSPNNDLQVLPHFNPIVQPTVQVGGVEVPKYECHLCQSVFLRVKDLAKHRAKMCTAWFN